MKKVLFVRSGGGMPGLDIHAGITLALAEAGIFSTHNVGTSAGAIISALDSAGWTATQIAAEVASLNDGDVRKERVLWKARAMWIDHYLSNEPAVELLEKLMPRLFTDLQKPCCAVATRVRDGKKVWFCGPDLEIVSGTVYHQLRPAVMASFSIHGVFPTVAIAGDEYADGGVRANLPLPPTWKEFDEVWLLIATPPVHYRQRRNIISRLLLNVAWLMRDQVEDVLEEVAGDPRVRVVWPDVGGKDSTLRFNHRLLNSARTLAAEQIKLLKQISDAPASEPRPGTGTSSAMMRPVPGSISNQEGES